jgi:hypothetical protein
LPRLVPFERVSTGVVLGFQERRGGRQARSQEEALERSPGDSCFGGQAFDGPSLWGVSGVFDHAPGGFREGRQSQPPAREYLAVAPGVLHQVAEPLWRVGVENEEAARTYRA